MAAEMRKCLGRFFIMAKSHKYAIVTTHTMTDNVHIQLNAEADDVKVVKGVYFFLVKQVVTASIPVANVLYIEKQCT